MSRPTTEECILWVDDHAQYDSVDTDVQAEIRRRVGLHEDLVAALRLALEWGEYAGADQDDIDAVVALLDEETDDES